MVTGWALIIFGLSVLAGSSVIEVRANPGVRYFYGLRKAPEGTQRPAIVPAARWLVFVGVFTLLIGASRVQRDGFSWGIVALVGVGTFVCLWVPQLVHNRRLAR